MGTCISAEDIHTEIEYLKERVFIQTAIINRLAIEHERNIKLIKQLSTSNTRLN